MCGPEGAGLIIPPVLCASRANSWVLNSGRGISLSKLWESVYQIAGYEICRFLRSSVSSMR